MSVWKNRGGRVLIGGSMLLILALLMAAGFPPLQVIEGKLFDLRFAVRGPLPPPPQVVIAAIDEKSLREVGRWQWNRDRLALLVDRLYAAGAEVVAFDIILAEPFRDDPVLARSLHQAGNVLLPLDFLFDGDSGNARCPDPAGYRTVLTSGGALAFFTASGVDGPVEELAGKAMSFGHINIVPDRDGCVREEVLAVRYHDAWYPSLDLHAAASFLGVTPENIRLDADGNLLVGTRSIPIDHRCRTVINYYGPERTFPRFPAADIMAGRVGKERLEGKIVLVGVTAQGLYDLRVTPTSPAMPGIEKHANVVASILEKRFIRKAPLWGDLLALAGSGLLVILILGRFRAAAGSAAVAALFCGFALLNYQLFARWGIWLNAAYPTTGMASIFLGITAMNYAREEKHARRIRGMFSSYVSPRVVDELIKNPEMARLGGARREVTVMFTDIRGFTSLSEKTSPEELVAQLNEYLSAMTEVVFRWEGTLDKFIGDAIVAFWGAPMAQENHAELALRCALHMTARLEELQRKWEAEGLPVLDIGIGINSGEVIVGNIGAEGKKMDYTVIGDHVNLGARVEGLTRKYGVRILITGYTLERVLRVIQGGDIGHVRVRGLEKVIVKGKENPVELYEVAGLDAETPSVFTACIEGAAVKMTEK
ncbi:MAG TPA: adenylate/guanylate cyclase domain-containing protein [Verrucomicrobiae bacterium]|nr:adenylate/guanylate cyclase domain-containing protein [Verrucomicrobiae bacterium]